MMIPARFWEKVYFGPSCWAWLGARSKKGYGQFHLDGKTMYAHRIAYETARGKIPDGFVIDHLCRHRDCVNHAHMEIVTNEENVWRGFGLTAQNRLKVTCIRGHALPPVTPGVPSRRRCKACRAIRENREAV